MKCGCKIVRNSYIGYTYESSIDFCRLHAAAEEMAGLLGTFCVDALQDDFNALKEYAMSAHIEYKDGKPIVIADPERKKP